jgi:hypothetical protein
VCSCALATLTTLGVCARSLLWSFACSLLCSLRAPCSARSLARYCARCIIAVCVFCVFAVCGSCCALTGSPCGADRHHLGDGGFLSLPPHENHRSSPVPHVVQAAADNVPVNRGTKKSGRPPSTVLATLARASLRSDGRRLLHVRAPYP